MNPQNIKPITQTFIHGGTINPADDQQQVKTNQYQDVQPAANVTATSMSVDPTPSKLADFSHMTEEELIKLKKINFKKKISGKEKRIRQNRKLFRMLTPRNAIAALNELHATSLNEAIVIPSSAGNKFNAKITINNVKYDGIGSSKMQAKNAACEKALRDLVISKLQNMKNQETQSEASEDVIMEDEKDEVPMLQLASYALHKLFSEWETDGFDIPFLKPPPPGTLDPQTSTEVKPNTPKPPKIRNELPPNSDTMHPVMLLSVMRPGTQYADLGHDGITPNIVHKVGTTVDNQQYIDQARSKKEARKRVATLVLKKLFNWEGSDV